MVEPSTTVSLIASALSLLRTFGAFSKHHPGVYVIIFVSMLVPALVFGGLGWWHINEHPIASNCVQCADTAELRKELEELKEQVANTDKNGFTVKVDSVFGNELDLGQLTDVLKEIVPIVFKSLPPSNPNVVINLSENDKEFIEKQLGEIEQVLRCRSTEYSYLHEEECGWLLQ